MGDLSSREQKGEIPSFGNRLLGISWPSSSGDGFQVFLERSTHLRISARSLLSCLSPTPAPGVKKVLEENRCRSFHVPEEKVRTHREDDMASLVAAPRQPSTANKHVS